MGGLLAGFREWLVVRVNGANNLVFEGLVEMLFAKSSPPDGNGTDEAKIEFLMATLDEFLIERSRWDGLGRVYAAHESWLRKQSWYRPSSSE